MKTLLSLAATAALIAIPTETASATSLTVGNEMTNACYAAASSGRADEMSITRCTLALQREATTSGDRRVATLVNRGILLMLEQDSAGAVRDFNEALAIDPTQAEAWLGKALESWKAGDDRQALDFANRAIQLRSDKPALAYLVRGLAHEGLGDVRAAYADLQSARRMAPGWDAPVEQLSRYQVVRR